jgi:hypothetical protein
MFVCFAGNDWLVKELTFDVVDDLIRHRDDKYGGEGVLMEKQVFKVATLSNLSQAEKEVGRAPFHLYRSTLARTVLKSKWRGRVPADYVNDDVTWTVPHGFVLRNLPAMDASKKLPEYLTQRRRQLLEN